MAGEEAIGAQKLTQNDSSETEAPAGMDWETYYAHRNKLDEIRIAQAASFDKSILGLSSGALAFSLVILSNFEKSSPVVSTSCLIYSWILFVMTIFLNIFSYLMSAKAAEIAIEAMDNRMRNQDWTGKDKNFCDEMTRVVNALSGIFFVAGAICLLVFAYKNGMGI